MKEEIIPDVSNKFLFVLGPCIAMLTALMAGVHWHQVSATRVRPSAGEFRRIATEKGLKDAIRWRDGPFKDVGG